MIKFGINGNYDEGYAKISAFGDQNGNQKALTIKDCGTDVPKLDQLFGVEYKIIE